jgi:putative acetyltransferase
LAPYSTGTEPRIIDVLRDAGGLTISLVADRRGEVLGHVAFSPVEIDGAPGDWFGLGPVAVAPPFIGLGVGKALIDAGLDRLRRLSAGGCAVLGDPGYCHRYGY